MYRSKKDVDKHVENLISKLSVKEFKSRACSIARLYYEVGDYTNCQRYVEQYLTQKENNAAAHKLLGQALQKIGQKEKALDQYKISLNIDPTQTSLILDICELLADDELVIDPGRAKYWCDKAEAIFPKHPVTFQLREKLVSMNNSDPEALVSLLKSELAVRPRDAVLHARLLKHYLQSNNIKEAFDHSCSVEFGEHTFRNNYAWYETIAEILKHQSHNMNDWAYQLLLLTVRERLCVLSLTEIPNSASKSLVESSELLHVYDQSIEIVAKTGAPSGFGDFHTSLLQHHRGQFAFHAATFLLKKANKDQLNWREAIRLAAPLMLIAWQTVPLHPNVNWLSHAPDKQQKSIHCWYTEGSFRCSQAGHYLLSNIQDKTQSFLDQVSMLCSGSHWRDKLYEKLFTNRDHLASIKSSHFVLNDFNNPTLRLPRKSEVEAYDSNAQREHPNSLHHFVWILLNYKNYAHFKCTTFEMLTARSYNSTNCGIETLNKLDIQAFLYCAALTAHQHNSKQVSYAISGKPNVLPANITDLLCSLSQMKWWDCAYKFSQNKLGTELSDIRATLSRGIEVVRCIDNHGLDPELLCILGSIFSELAKFATVVDERNNLKIRAGLYYSSAIPYLDKLKNKIIVKMPEKRLFDYTHKELSTKELNSLIEESKLYVAINYLHDCEYEKVIDMLSNLKSPQAFYHISETYNKMALEEYNLYKDSTAIDMKNKCVSLFSKAKSYAYKALERLKDTEIDKSHHLYSDIHELLEGVETHINKLDSAFDSKFSFDDNLSSSENEYVSLRANSHIIRNLSSTPKQTTKSNTTNYRTAIEPQLFESSRGDQQFLERIENQIKNLQKRDTTINDFMEQTKTWFEENRKQGNQIINTIHSNIQNTTDQFKLLKISVDHVKDQIDECRNECKDVGELKKQIAELKKEVNKLKKASSEQTLDESDLYNLEEDYNRTNENSSTFAQLPFTPSQVMPQFNQRLIPPFPVPPNPYQFYGQNLYNLYNQYTQFTQPPPVAGPPPMFDSTRTNYPGVFPTPDQMYLDVAHLAPTNIPAAPTVSTVPIVPVVPTISSVASVSLPTATSTITTKPASGKDTKEISRSLPVNVVITSSDPLPTCTTAPAPILSVTIPPKHIKSTPHNYQIPMPSTNDTKVLQPPIFSFPVSANKTLVTTTASPLTNWNRSTIFKTTESTPTNKTASASKDSSLYSSKFGDTLDNSISIVDGGFIGTSPNTSLNKSRTLSEKSNTSVENYDPCPDFKPIIPLPAEVKVMTGEEDETVLFSSRAKLFRFVDKQWKERGLGEMKLLKHKVTEKVRVLMRREQIHKVCANHIITPEIEIKPMKNETKAYFWVANDFADETMVLEKFCIRFKTADIAQKFYDVFEKARQESIAINESISKSDEPNAVPDKFSTTIKCSMGQSIESQLGKTVVGGFTFTTTPTFKSVADSAKPAIESAEPATTKVNVFSGLNFKTTTSSPFNNLFNNNSSANTNSPKQFEDSSSKLNNSDTVEEFEPTIEFKPVVPLPALVDHKTGEEDEIILFEHRAKLLRYDATNKEWKERGLGNIKILAHKDNIQKLRILMRREQVMKVCCNHAVTKEMIFQKMPNVDKAVTWCAKDFSEGELVSETFCLRFKTVQACDNFIEAIKLAQSKMKDESKAAKEEQNATKQSNQSGFGDKFKLKEGSWSCETCYTNNLENFEKCACCEQPKPHSLTTSVVSNIPNPSSTWGDNFKPKPGTWECKECLIRNDASVENCSACNSPKDPTKIKAEIKAKVDNAPKFNFGIPAQTSINIQTKRESPVSTTPLVSGWGDMFKPKEGTWECKQCFVRNESSVEQCSACNNPKDTDTHKTETKSIFTSGSKFNFGINLTTSHQDKPETKTTSIFDGTGAHKFSFGIPSNTQDKGFNVLTFGDQKSITSVIFANPKASVENEEPVSIALKMNDQQNKTLTKPALLPTPSKDNSSTPFGAKEGGTFDFVFKPKITLKGKSPVKSPKSEKDDESDGNEYVSEEHDDEGHHIHFSPVIPLPDKVEVVTGEENEDELYGHRAKLFRFISGEWKERGIGIVKILKHKDNGKLRVVMRREQVLKICLNHALTSDIIYTPKDDKTWLFAANDFSEGELSPQQFCLRFKNKDIAIEFKNSIDKAREGKSIPPIKDIKSDAKEDKNSDDVIFVKEIQATSEDKQKAKELMLPENFFTYKNKEPCQGCRGCQDDDEAKPVLTVLSTKDPTVNTSVFSTPAKISTQSFQSPTTSIYGTPTNFNKTTDSTIFRTPLESFASKVKSTPFSISDDTLTNETIKAADISIFRSPLESIESNTKPTLLGTNNSNVLASDATNKENTFVTKSSIFDGFGVQKSVLGTPQHNSANLFGAGDTQTPLSTKSSILAAPKLSALNLSAEEKQSSEPKSIFGQSNLLFGESKSMFGNTTGGVSTNKSIFGFSANSNKNDNQKPEIKSIFGGDTDNKPVNLFSSSVQGSLFGPNSLKSNLTKSGTGIFEPNATSAFSANTSDPAPVFRSTLPIFSAPSTQTPKWHGSIADEKKSDVNTLDASQQKKTDVVTVDDKTVEKGAQFKMDSTLTFAALSSSGPGFQKTDNFQWEGAGQQLFVAAQKTAKEASDKANNESGAGDEADATVAGDEEYDPHYEPIVPLPDKIVVTTGEEDEEKLFGDRCKLYRYDEKSRMWKERGVGEMKLLYHPERKTYRFLLRREQVHKAVLNMLLHPDLELLPMKNSDRAWTWAGRNYAESAAGEQETLAVRYKSVELANGFRDKVVQCVRKLQAAAAQAIREEKESTEKYFGEVAPLRLPKHLDDNARVDYVILAKVEEQTQATDVTSISTRQSQADTNSTGQVTPTTTELTKQVHFEEPEEEEHADDDEDYEHDYDNNEDYDAYYNEDEEESAAFYSCEGEAVVVQGDTQATCPEAHIQVLFDQDVYSPKILVTDSTTGEILADMLIHTDTAFQVTDKSCTWSGKDYTNNDPVDKTVTINFHDSDTAMQFYDTCETSKATTTYSSPDPET